MAKPHLPVLIGCGSAAGISAIFNSPIGGLLFTLEVILRDFSIRTLTPLVIASVIANFTTRSIFIALGHTEEYLAIFNMPPQGINGYTLWTVGNFILLGIVCGLVGVALTRLMYGVEHFFGKLKIGKEWKPAMGGAMLGVIGVMYVLAAGCCSIGRSLFRFSNIRCLRFSATATARCGPCSGRRFMGRCIIGSCWW